jgi:16S rRNA processing protein RimM
VQVGTVSGAHGYDGRLRIETETDNPARFRPGAAIWLAGEPYKVVRSSSGGVNGVLVKLEGLDSREEVAAFLHAPVTVPEDDVPAPPADTYYHYQLLDVAVVDEAGASLGTLTEILATGANDVYVITDDAGELLLPALGDVVLTVDIAERRMTVAVPEGIERRLLGPPKAARPVRWRRRPARPKGPATSS